jgi:hypothetical protein
LLVMHRNKPETGRRAPRRVSGARPGSGAACKWVSRGPEADLLCPSIVVGVQTLKEVPERLCITPLLPFATVCQADGHVDEPRVKSQTAAAQLQGAGTI